MSTSATVRLRRAGVVHTGRSAGEGIDSVLLEPAYLAARADVV